MTLSLPPSLPPSLIDPSLPPSLYPTLPPSFHIHCHCFCGAHAVGERGARGHWVGPGKEDTALRCNNIQF